MIRRVLCNKVDLIFARTVEVDIDEGVLNVFLQAEERGEIRDGKCEEMYSSVYCPVTVSLKRLVREDIGVTANRFDISFYPNGIWEEDPYFFYVWGR